MNVQDCWPKSEELPPLTARGWESLFKLRTRTAHGFQRVELDNGVPPIWTLNSPIGQENFKMMMFRAIEETCESIQATEEPHQLEELVDSINYLMICIIQFREIYNPSFPALLTEALEDLGYRFGYTWGHSMNFEKLGTLTMILGYEIGDHMRIRTWTRNRQELQFTRHSQVRLALIHALDLLIKVFPDWKTFTKYFIAKDRVLQFRLKSQY